MAGIIEDILRDRDIDYELISGYNSDIISLYKFNSFDIEVCSSLMKNIYISADLFCILYKNKEWIVKFREIKFILVVDNFYEKFKEVKECADVFNNITIIYLPNVTDLNDMYLLLSKDFENLQERMKHLLQVEYLTLVNLLARGADISDIEAYAHKLLGNPMIITDESYKVIANTKDSKVQDPIWESIISNMYSPADIVEQTDVNSFWKRLDNSSLPLFVDDNAFKGLIRRVVAKIKVGSYTKGYIALLEYEKRITSLDLQILQMIAEVLSVKINEKDTVMRATGQLRNEFSGDLLTRKMSEQMIENRARSLGLHFCKWTSVICVRAMDEKQYIGVLLEDIRLELKKHCNLCIYTFNGNYAYYIISYDEKVKWEQFLSEYLENIMKKARMICIASLPTNCLTKINICYKQVESLNQLLESFLEDERYVYPYSIFAPFDLIEDIFSSEKYEKLSRAYKSLLEIDSRDKSEYINTLRCYFANNQNVAKTADRLFVHRNTVNYRLDKIRKILEDDFDDYRIRLHLQLSILADDLNK